MSNPIAERGMFFSAQEHELVSNALAAMVQQAREHGRGDFADALMSVLVKMKQHVMAGQEIPPDMALRFGKRLQKALQSQDDDAVRAAIVDMSAAMLRMDPDPAQRIAELVVSLFATSSAAQRIADLQTIIRRLAHEREAFEQDGWPGDDGTAGAGAREVYDWTRQLLEGALENAQEGRALFPDEEIH